MFCPQCRLSWPKGSANSPKLAKIKDRSPHSPEWGHVHLCPNCLIPLAADRIQGEFPSVAHASSMKEGTVTVKDVLRESGIGEPSDGEVPLDDKPKIYKFGLFDKDASGKVNLGANMKSLGGRNISASQRLAVFAVIILFASIVSLGLHAMFATEKIMKKAVPVKGSAAGAALAAGNTGLTASQAALLKLMPADIGPWTRCEQNQQIWTDANVGNSTAQTYASTYRNGDERVEFWATIAPAVNSGSPLTNFAGASRAVHTDSGVINIAPVASDPEGKPYLEFDYSPSTPDDHYWIMSNQNFAPGLAHTISWYAQPYVVTVASDSLKDRENFLKAMNAASL